MATKKAVWQGFVKSPETGKPVSGAEVRVFDADSGAAVTLYGDRDGGAGPGNPFFTGSDGFAQFYVDPARIRIEAYDGGLAAQFDDVLVGTVDEGGIVTASLADGSVTRDKASSDIVTQVANVTELRALTGLADGQVEIVAESGKSNAFAWRSGDQSANVTALPDVWLPPVSDPTGVSGAWELLDPRYILRFAEVEMLSGSGDKYHATFRNLNDNTLCLVYTMPRMSTIDGDRPIGQTAAFKAFMDDYEQYRGGGSQGYRDTVLAAETDESHNGAGRGAIRTNVGGDYVPFWPELAICTRSGNEGLVARAVRLQPTPALRTNYNNDGGFYKFKENYPIWTPNLSVDAGDIVHLYGRIYEAQNGGTTGATRPMHDGVGGRLDSTGDPTVVGTAVNNTQFYASGTTGGPFVNGETLTGGTSGATATLASRFLESGVEDMRVVNVAGTFQTGETLTGGTSGATTTLDTIETPSAYEESDGAVVWQFVEDLKPIYSGNLFHNLFVLGGPDDDPIVGFDGTQFLRDAFTKAGVKQRFIRTTEDEADGAVYRDADAVIVELEDSQSRGGARTIRTRVRNSANAIEGEVIQSSSRATDSGIVRVGSGQTHTSGTTLDVTGTNVIVLNLGSATTITSVTGIVDNALYTIRASNGNATLSHGAGAFNTSTGANYAMMTNEAMTFIGAGGRLHYVGARS